MKIFKLIILIAVFTHFSIAAISTKPVDTAVLQRMIRAAQSGDTVIVTSGIYHIKKRVTIDKDLTLISEDGAASTIIRSDGSERCMYLTDNAITVSGFTIEYGNAQSEIGGGVYCESTKPVIDHCIIKNNSAYDAGGVYKGTLTHCTLDKNTASHWGGASEHSTMYNCLITHNSAKYSGGIHFGELNNCSVAFNSAYGAGNYKGIGGCMYTIVRNSIVYWNNDLNYLRCPMTNCCTYPAWGENAINAQPRFRAIYPENARNFRLHVTSPCINKGSNALTNSLKDLDGNQRVHFETVDIGCYEYVPEPMLFSSSFFILIILIGVFLK